MGLLSSMPPTDWRLDHKIQKHPLKKNEILEKITSRLMAWNQDENIVRENISNQIQKACQDSEDMT